MSATVIVAPRERFTSLPVSLKSLFATIKREVPVIVVEGGSPEEVRAELRALAAERPFTHISLPYMMKPNEARNIGLRETRTEYAVLTDNDIHYEQGWLEALERHAEAHGSDAVAPVICIGPPAAKIVHHAGGRLYAYREAGKLFVNERHRLDNKPIGLLRPDFPEIDNHVCEFHCMMVRRGFAERIGWLDERLITREQMDFALRALVLGGKVTFAHDSIVTYMAKNEYIALDFDYFLFRWAGPFVEASMDAFEENWGVALDREMVRSRWIGWHRSLAGGTMFPWKRKLMTQAMFLRTVVDPMERTVMAKQLPLRAHLTPNVPVALPREGIARVMEALAASGRAGAEYEGPVRSEAAE